MQRKTHASLLPSGWLGGRRISSLGHADNYLAVETTTILEGWISASFFFILRSTRWTIPQSTV
jgi:hypothetical protein